MIIISGIILMGVLCLFVWVKRRQKVRNTDFLKNIPEPASSLPFLGIALDFSSTKVVLSTLVKYMDTCGDVAKGSIGPFRQFLLIADYKLLEFVLSSTKTITKSKDYDFLKPWLGTGLLTSDGQKWKKHRRILTPAFHFKILEQFVQIFESRGNELIRKFEENVGQTSFNVYPYVTLYTLDVICESIMGTNVNAQYNEKSEYVQSVKNMCKIVVERVLSFVQMHDWLFPLSQNYYTQKKALAVLHRQSHDVIEARQKELKKIDQNNSYSEGEVYFKNKKPFLDLLLQTTVDGQPLTPEKIRQEVDTFMFEGHDTTASAISFTLFCLAEHSDVQRKAFEEQQNIFQNRIDAVPTYLDLQNMKYLELVIKESLRLYPSVPFYNREVTEDIQYGDNIIPKGITLMLLVFKIQRNPKYFKNPEEFKPERFENDDGKLPYAYLPFSAGPRNCIGQKFAMVEMKCILSKILRKFELEPASPKHELQLLAEVILKSANGINIRIHKRR